MKRFVIYNVNDGLPAKLKQHLKDRAQKEGRSFFPMNDAWLEGMELYIKKHGLKGPVRA